MSARSDGCLTCLSVLGVLALLVAEIGRGLLVTPGDAVRAASTYGFGNPVVQSSSWFIPGLAGCDAGDALVVNLQATNPLGNRVGILACSGFPFKGWTVRVK